MRHGHRGDDLRPSAQRSRRVELGLERQRLRGLLGIRALVGFERGVALVFAEAP